MILIDRLKLFTTEINMCGNLKAEEVHMYLCVNIDYKSLA